MKAEYRLIFECENEKEAEWIAEFIGLHVVKAKEACEGIYRLNSRESVAIPDFKQLLIEAGD